MSFNLSHKCHSAVCPFKEPKGSPAPEQLCSPRPCPVPTLFHPLPATSSFRTQLGQRWLKKSSKPLFPHGLGAQAPCALLQHLHPRWHGQYTHIPTARISLRAESGSRISVFQLLVHRHSGSASQMLIKMIKPARLSPGPALLLSGLKILVENLLCAQPSTGTLLGILTS